MNGGPSTSTTTSSNVNSRYLLPSHVPGNSAPCLHNRSEQQVAPGLKRMSMNSRTCSRKNSTKFTLSRRKRLVRFTVTPLSLFYARFSAPSTYLLRKAKHTTQRHSLCGLNSRFYELSKQPVIVTSSIPDLITTRRSQAHFSFGRAIGPLWHSYRSVILLDASPRPRQCQSGYLRSY